MARVFLSIGSNIERERNIRVGIDELRRHFGKIRLSSIYRSAAVGFDGDDFYNLVAEFDTPLTPRALAALLRQIEERNGRTRSGTRFSSRTLDIDLILYEQQVIDEEGLSLPREEILKYAFVLQPLAELAPDERHPLSGETYGSLWTEFDKTAQRMERVELDLSPDLPLVTS